jgi:hypothetical protein
MRFPFKSVTEQLHGLLVQPGMEELLDEWRRLDRRTCGECLQDMFDGHVTHSILDPDGRLFFFFRNEPQDQNGPNNELRIGLTLGADG